MEVFIYKLNNEKTKEIQKSTELQAQVNDLSGTVSDLQGKIESISNTINSNTTKQDNNTANQSNTSKSSNNNTTSNSNTSSSNTSATSTSSSSKDNTKNKILGAWQADKAVDSEGNEVGLSIIFGTGIIQSNEMEFKENGIFLYGISITASSDDGTYTVNGNTIKCGIPTDIKGNFTWETYTYIPEEDVLKQELDSYGEKQIVTYIRKN